MKFEALKTWLPEHSENLGLIAGPCSAETEEQLLSTARQLSAKGVKVLRAGIWKPRTRPGAFEGIGVEALAWMNTAKQETGMLTSTEVANVKHVYAALKAGIDILWIGARTSVNPFAVQEIADALKGVDIPVIIKNPVNPDIDLWYGAIERISGAGITKIAALHRGFSSLSKSVYRNDPQWQIPIELKRRLKDLPILCDPSHITGRRDMIFKVSQKALDLNYDGLMIETHISPKDAWSDANQQVTPTDLSKIMDKLMVRASTSDSANFVESLEELRSKINNFDNQIFELLSGRMEVAAEIGKIKKADNIAVLQTSRWDEIVRKAAAKAEETGLNQDFIQKVYAQVHQESINIQTAILDED